MNILLIISLITCFFCGGMILPMVRSLAKRKKAIGIFIKQVDKNGKITSIDEQGPADWDITNRQYDISPAFNYIPGIRNNPTYNKFPQLIELENEIKQLRIGVRLVITLFLISGFTLFATALFKFGSP
jgi:hypothetical protein